MKSLSPRIFALGMLLILATGWSNRPSQAAQAPIVSDFSDIDSYIEAEMEAARIPGVALAIVQGGEIVYLKGYGAADSSGRPVTPETPFAIASTVKSFTALAIMQLVEAGSVELDAPVQRYLPWFAIADANASAQITIRHLLTHTSGLPEAAGNELPPSQDMSHTALENRVRRLSAAELNRPVGERYGYSSANYDTLGLVVQTVSRQPFEAYIQEQILEPLAMRHTFMTMAEAEQQGAATGYRSWFGFPVAFDAPRQRAYTPSGWAMASSAEDLARYAIAQLNQGGDAASAVLGVSPAGFAAMHEPAVRSYRDTSYTGLGWGTATTGGIQTIGAGGDAMNFKSRVLLVPEMQLGIVVLINMNSVNVNSGRFDIDRAVLALLLGQQPPAPAAVHFLPIYPAMLAVLFVALLFGADLVRLLVRWRRQGIHGAPWQPRWRAIAGVALPTVLALVWSLLLLVGFPLIGGRSLPFLLLYIPDFGATLVASAVLALVWAALRVWLWAMAHRRQPLPGSRDQALSGPPVSHA
jgi:CubicO group peptidase (beta-lactamase class C family)